MSNLDDSIGKILLDLQKEDPEDIQEIDGKSSKENPELFENDIDVENKAIEEYNQEIDEYNKKIDK